MAGEISHVVYGARVLTALRGKVTGPEYWLGTLFPDIRHLGVISRHRTHPENISLSTLSGNNDWHTGARVHAWVDMTRQHYLDEANVKETLPWHPFVPHALKLLEDEWVYDEFEDWDVVHNILDTVAAESLEIVPSKEHVVQWHRILQDYFAQKPTDESRAELHAGIGLSQNSSDEVNTLIGQLKRDQKAREVIEGFWQHFDMLLH